MKNHSLLITLFFTCQLFSQEISFQVVDSLHQESIPFATVMTNFGANSITNEEGFFRLHVARQLTIEDSLFVSSMGYETFQDAFLNLKDSIIYLPQKIIALNNVIVSQNTLSAEEIVKKVNEQVKEKYDLSFNVKTFFMRESYYQKWEKLELNIDKTSIKEFNQRFWDSLFTTLPKKDEFHTESFGKIYGDWSEKNQKLHLLKAADLADTLNQRGYEQIESKITTILDESVKENSYFKFKSGLLFSAKIDREDLIEKEDDSLESDQQNEEENKAKRFHKNRKNQIVEAFTSLIKGEKLDISVLKKTHLYTYEITDFTYINTVPVYQISFQPSGSKGKFKGVLYVDADNYSLIQMTYENTQSLKNISLFGFSFDLFGQTVNLKFNQFKRERYQLQFIERENRFKIRIDRPLKIVEKNKYVKGRRKQNELKGQLLMQLNQSSKFTLVLFDNTSITEKDFSELKEEKTFKQDRLDSYDPNYWKDFTIIEPNAAIQSFKVHKD